MYARINYCRHDDRKSIVFNCLSSINFNADASIHRALKLSSLQALKLSISRSLFHASNVSCMQHARSISMHSLISRIQS